MGEPPDRPEWAETATQPQGAVAACAPPLAPLAAWRNALGITLLGCLLLGVGNMILLGGRLSQWPDLSAAAVWLAVSFTVTFGTIAGLITLWQRAHGSSLRALGWAKPTTPLALALGVGFGMFWLSFSYFGFQAIQEQLPQLSPPRLGLVGADPTAITWTRFALIPLGIGMAIAEELMMRGFFMTQLNRAGVATSIRILASGSFSASYHVLQNDSWQGFIFGFLSSAVIFSILAGLYVLGKRSLTPSIVAHGTVHAFGEPYLIMMLLAIM